MRAKAFINGAAILAMLGAMEAADAVWADESRPTLEYQIKASYFYNFLHFVEWPKTAFKNGDEKLVLGIIGPNRFGVALDKIKGTEVKGRKIEVRLCKSSQDAEGCHALFIGVRNKIGTKVIVEALKDKPILTITEEDGMAERGASINLIKRKDKIRFEVNRSAGQAKGLSFQSQLLRLAVDVYDDRKAE